MADAGEEKVPEGIEIFTIEEVLNFGLTLIGYKQRKIERAKDATNRTRFKSHYGASPTVAAIIYSDLQVTTIEDAFVPSSKRSLKFFLMALHHLKVYPTEIQREATFDISPSYGRQWVWYYVKKIQALKESRIVWPHDFGPSIWVITVDGIHCWVNEPTHAIWSQDRRYFSHKYNHAGLSYELGISLTGGLVWMNGPFRAGWNDKKIFVEGGLRDRLVSIGKKAIADSGYVGYTNAVSTPNPHDDDEVKRFKSRATLRHAYDGEDSSGY